MDSADTTTTDLHAQDVMRATPSPEDDHLAGYTSLTRYAAIDYGGSVPHIHDRHGMNLTGCASDYCCAANAKDTSNG